MVGRIMGAMNMKKIIIALSLLPALAGAVTSEQIESVRQANSEVLKQKGLPTPDSGIQLVPQASFNVKGWQAQQYLIESKEMKEKGYINRSSDRAYELLNLPDVM